MYSDVNTPLDSFDSMCHETKEGIKEKCKELFDDKFMLLINTAEHINRPIDMLMLIGEYFKEVIIQTTKISENIINKKTT